jgi:hypothetical protein
MMKKKWHLMILLTFLLSAGGFSEDIRTERDQVKGLLKYNDWVNASKDGTQYLFIKLNIPEILDDGFTYSCALDSSTECSIYKVECYKSENEKKIHGFEDLEFTISIFPDVAKARESVIDQISNSSAPIDFLDRKWRKENSSLGDKAFGNGLWCMGNAVIRLGNRDFDQALAKNIFSRFENYFRQKAVSKEMDILPLQGSVGDGSVRLDAFPEKSTVFITAPADYDMTVGEKNKFLRINKPDREIDMNKIHVNTVRSNDVKE